MEHDDRFAAVLEQFTQELRLEHHRQLDALNAEIIGLKMSEATSGSPARQLSGDRPEAPEGPESTTQRGRAASDADSRTSSKVSRGSRRQQSSRNELGGSPEGVRATSGMRRATSSMSLTTTSNMAGAIRRGLTFRQSRQFVVSQSREDSYEPSGCPLVAFIERVVRSWAFDLGVSVLIAVYLICVAIEAQRTCDFVAEDFGYSSAHASPDERATIETAFATMDLWFGVAFTVEIVLRIVGTRIRFFLDSWNWMDFALVTHWFITLGTMMSPLNPMLLRTFRIVRIFRMVKLVRRFSGFDALHLMMTSLRKSVSIIAWGSCLILTFLMFLALMAHEILLNTYLKDRSAPFSEREEIYRYFGSFTRTLFSMFELTLANWPPIARALSENVSEWFMLVTILHKLTVGLALVGVINAVFIQETFRAAQDDAEVLWRRAKMARRQHDRNMLGLMREADRNFDGRLDIAEFRQIFTDPVLRTWLASLEFRQEDADELFDFMDVDGDGFLSVDKIAAGVARLRGTARTIDLHILMKANRRHFEEQLLTLRGSTPATTVGGHTSTHENVLKLQPAEDI